MAGSRTGGSSARPGWAAAGVAVAALLALSACEAVQVPAGAAEGGSERGVRQEAVEGSRASRFATPTPTETAFAPEVPETTRADGPPSTGGEADAGEDGGAAAPRKRLMIYTARFELLVSRTETAIRDFVSRAQELGGYLQSREDETVTCRVPAERFEDFIASVRSLGKVVQEAVHAQEVTRQYNDLTLRLEAAKTSRDRLLELLERAETTEDLLAIEKEIRRLTEEIETLQGELRYLRDRIAYSTVEVRFRSAAPEPKPVPRRERSRFDWINQVGVEHVLRSF